MLDFTLHKAGLEELSGKDSCLLDKSSSRCSKSCYYLSRPYDLALDLFILNGSLDQQVEKSKKTP